MKHLIGVMAKMRTIDSRGSMVLATGHATPEEHLLLAREGRAQGLQVLLTHPGNIPQLPEVAKLGAFIEIVDDADLPDAGRRGDGRCDDPQGRRRAHHHLDGLRPDHQPLSERLPRGGGARAARRGITQREIDLMYKVNPAKLLGLPPPPEALVARQ